MTDLKKLALRSFISACTLFTLSNEVLAEGPGRSASAPGQKMRMNRPGQARGMQQRPMRQRVHDRMDRRMGRKKDRRDDRGPRDFSQGRERPRRMERFGDRPPMMERRTLRGRRDFQERKDFRQERIGDRREFKQDRREDRQQFREGEMDRKELANIRREEKRDFREGRRMEKREFQEGLREEKRDFRRERRGPASEQGKENGKASNAPVANNVNAPDIDIDIDTN